MPNASTTQTAELLAPINAFLHCATPQRWLQQATRPENQSLLLIDHANCEKKAASTALNLLYRYISFPELLNKLSKLAREELRHFEQVIAIMKQRNIDYVFLSASRYASGLRDMVSKQEPFQLIDTLLCGAIIEARSCERFAALVPLLDDELGDFYLSLLKSESRHFRDYLALAEKYIRHNADMEAEYLEQKTRQMLAREAELINEPDRNFRFHSGPDRA